PAVDRNGRPRAGRRTEGCAEQRFILLAPLAVGIGGAEQDRPTRRRRRPRPVRRECEAGRGTTPDKVRGAGGLRRPGWCGGLLVRRSCDGPVGGSATSIGGYTRFLCGSREQAP